MHPSVFIPSYHDSFGPLPLSNSEFSFSCQIGNNAFLVDNSICWDELALGDAECGCGL